MDKNSELIDALKQIEREKGIDSEIIFQAIEASLVTACKKNYGQEQAVTAVVDRITGKVRVFAQKTVVEEVVDGEKEISVDDARKINKKYEIGDTCEIAVTPKDFGRISAQTAKQVVVQKIREAERNKVYNEFKKKEHGIITGVIQRKAGKNIIVDLGRIEASISPADQIPGELYVFNERIKLYVSEVKDSLKGPIINVSRTNPELVKKLFEQEIPEVYDGVIEIKAVSREPGSRSKVAVFSKNPHVDAVGSCVGQDGRRVWIIVRELNGEKMDIIEWHPSIRLFIASALSPGKVLAVAVNEAERSAKVVVPDNQLSLAIGKDGQNARLAVRLCGFKIDIKSESQAKDIGFVSKEDYLEYVEDVCETQDASSADYYEDEYYDDEYYEIDKENENADNEEYEYYDEDDDYYEDYEEYYEDEKSEDSGETV
ncbi:MAG: transcription termination factor NusA [Clostridiales bacterium]|nr:transcription termination factor NusA [Clostridiales bacterium]